MPDLPRRRPPSSSWTQPIRERLSPTIKTLVIAQIVLFAFFKLVPPLRVLLMEHLAVGPRLLAGEVWQPLTALFVHAEGWSLFFNIIGLWYVGAFTERVHGTRRFLLLYLGAGVAANLAAAAVAHQTYQAGEAFFGASYAILALFVAYGRSYGRAQTQVWGGLFLQAQTLALILVGWSVVANLYEHDWAGVASSLTAAAVGFLWAGGRPGELIGFLRNVWPRRSRRRYQVLDGGQAPPKRRKTYIN